MHHYPFHLGDYASHTAHLSPIEDIIYRRMLDVYYRTESSLPGDALAIGRLIRMSEYIKEIEIVLSEYFVLFEERRVNKRVENEIESYRRMKDGAKRGATNRWAKAGNALAIATLCPGDALAMPCLSPGVCQPEPEPEPEPINTEANASLSSATPTGFIEFWEAWPSSIRKQSKSKCLDAWKKNKAERDSGLVIAHVESMKLSDDWQKQGGQFIPSPLVYINGKRWDGAEITVRQTGVLAGAI